MGSLTEKLQRGQIGKQEGCFRVCYVSRMWFEINSAFKVVEETYSEVKVIYSVGMW